MSNCLAKAPWSRYVLRHSLLRTPEDVPCTSEPWPPRPLTDCLRRRLPREVAPIASALPPFERRPPAPTVMAMAAKSSSILRRSLLYGKPHLRPLFPPAPDFGLTRPLGLSPGLVPQDALQILGPDIRQHHV